MESRWQELQGLDVYSITDLDSARQTITSLIELCRWFDNGKPAQTNGGGPTPPPPLSSGGGFAKPAPRGGYRGGGGGGGPGENKPQTTPPPKSNAPPPAGGAPLPPPPTNDGSLPLPPPPGGNVPLPPPPGGGGGGGGPPQPPAKAQPQPPPPLLGTSYNDQNGGGGDEAPDQAPDHRGGLKPVPAVDRLMRKRRNSQVLNSAVDYLDGILHLKGRTTDRWQPLFFVLSNGMLTYWRSREAQSQPNAQPLANIPLLVCKVMIDPKYNLETGFELQVQKNSYFLNAASREERQKWIDALGGLQERPDARMGGGAGGAGGGGGGKPTKPGKSKGNAAAGKAPPPKPEGKGFKTLLRRKSKSKLERRKSGSGMNYDGGEGAADEIAPLPMVGTICEVCKTTVSPLGASAASVANAKRVQAETTKIAKNKAGLEMMMAMYEKGGAEERAVKCQVQNCDVDLAKQKAALDPIYNGNPFCHGCGRSLPAMTVLFTFEARTPAQTTVNQGETAYVFNEEADGWLTVMNGETYTIGKVPANYLGDEKALEAAVASGDTPAAPGGVGGPPPPGSMGGGGGAGGAGPPPPQSASSVGSGGEVTVGTALYAYESGGQEGHLDVAQGAEVTLITDYGDGWVEVTDNASGATGVAPTDYFEFRSAPPRPHSSNGPQSSNGPPVPVSAVAAPPPSSMNTQPLPPAGTPAPAPPPRADATPLPPAPASVKPTPTPPAPVSTQQSNTTAMGTARATVLYHYAGGDEGAVPVSEGESVTILEDAGDGWTKVGKADGSEGFVPSNYLEEAKSSRPPSMSAMGGAQRSPGGGGGPPPPSSTTGGGGGGGGPPKQTAKVNFAYSALQTGELSVSEGEVLDLVEDHGDGWITVSRPSDGSSGVVPLSYVTIDDGLSAEERSAALMNRLKAEAQGKQGGGAPPQAQASAPAPQQQQSQAPASTASAAQSEWLSAKMMYKFDAQHPTQLSAAKHQEIYVIEDLKKKGWYLAADADGNQGHVPMNYVTLV